MNNKTEKKVRDLARETVKIIKSVVLTGQYRPEFPGEKPTFERIKHSSRLNFGMIPEYRNVFKTKAQYTMFDNLVYSRLRRDSILKKMREDF